MSWQKLVVAIVALAGNAYSCASVVYVVQCLLLTQPKVS